MARRRSRPRIPTGTGVIELVSDGPLTWVDPRVVRDLPLGPYVWALACRSCAG